MLTCNPVIDTVASRARQVQDETPFPRLVMFGAVDATVVPIASFTGVTKHAAPKGPATAPIIPGVAILARLGIAQRHLKLCYRQGRGSGGASSSLSGGQRSGVKIVEVWVHVAQAD